MRNAFRLTLALALAWVMTAVPGLATRAGAQDTAANEAVVRQFFEEVLSQGNMDLIDDLFAPDFVLHATTDPSGDVPGLEGVHGFVGGVRGAFPDLTYTVEDLISEGDTVVVRWSNQGTNQGPFQGIPATGKTVSILGANLFHLANQKITEEWGFPDNLTLLVQLGVVPGGDQLATAVPPSPVPGAFGPEATPASADSIRTMAQAFWDVYNANDLEGFKSYFAPDFINYTPAPGFPPTAEGFADTMTFFRSGFPDQQADLQEVVVEGDMVAMRVVLQGTHTGFAYGVQPTGRVVTYNGLEIARVRDGKFVEAWGFYDQVSILMQLGAIPGGAPPADATPAGAAPIASPQADAQIDWAAYSQLAVTGSEAGFEAPDSIEGGLVAMSFQNAGTTNHMAMLIRPAEGVTVDQLEAAIKADPLNQVTLREMVVSSGGTGGVAPGAQQRVILNVEPGQYLLADFEFAEDGTPFVAKSGLKRLEVTSSTRGDLPEPAADATIELIDFAFVGMPSGVAAGTYVFKVVNDGVEPHELALVKLDEGVSMMDAFAQQPQPGQPLPFTFWGGIQDMAPGMTAWVEVTFTPGEFVAFCPIVYPETGQLHVMLGMFQSVVAQ